MKVEKKNAVSDGVAALVALVVIAVAVFVRVTALNDGLGVGATMVLAVLLLVAEGTLAIVVVKAIIRGVKRLMVRADGAS